MSTWITPEEMERRRKRNRILLYFSLPLIAVALSATITLLANSL